MKKYNLLKVIAITIVVVWILTLFVPGSYVDYSGKVVKDAISAKGVWGLLSDTSISISYFNGIAVFLIAVACFYGILNKTESYNNFINKAVNLFSGKERLLVSISIIIFGIMAVLVSDFLVLIVFMPLVYKIMKRLEIDNKVVLASTALPCIIGAMFGIYNKTLFDMFALKLNTLLLIKVIMLVISLFVLIMFVAPKNKNKKLINEIKAEKKVDSKKKAPRKKVTK